MMRPRHLSGHTVTVTYRDPTTGHAERTPPARNGRPAARALAAVCATLFGVAASAYTPSEDIVRLMNHGVGLMEQYRFTDAVATFGEVADRAPDWPLAHLNLGIAYLNAVSDPDKPGSPLDSAGVEFARAAELDPTMPNPHYCLGMLKRYRGKMDEAAAHFARVLELSPGHADSLYFLGQMRLSDGKPEEAEVILRQAIDANPYLLSAHYSLSQALIRQKRREEAFERIEIFQTLSEAGVGVKRAIVYTEMGEYADVVRVYPPASDAAAAPEISVTFTLVETAIAPPESAAPVGFALSDFDADGDLDALFPSRADGRSHFYANENGEFTSVAVLPGSPSATGAAVGDYDNDGDDDAYLLLVDGGALLRNDGGWAFTDVTDAAAIAPIGHAGVSATWIDADHEGDLDLLVTHATGILYYRNDGDGTFTEMAEAAGLAAPAMTPLIPAFGDFDMDLDVDVALSTSVFHVMANDRLNKWSPSLLAAAPSTAGGGTLISVDFDRDGDADVLRLSNDDMRGALLYLNDGRGDFRAHGWSEGLAATNATVLDVDNDGDLDIFAPHGRWGATEDLGPVLLVNDGAGSFAELSEAFGLADVRLPNAGALAAADIDGDGDTDILIARDGAAPVLLRNDGGNANNWLHIDLEGALANRSGYGARVEVKAGSLWQTVERYGSGGPMLASNPRIEVGLGKRPSADFVRILWANAVLQSELEVVANQLHVIGEVQRKASSCPILFSWDGERFDFVTDFMGVGGLGFFVAPGIAGVPDPTERVKIEAGQIAPRDGEYVFQIMEPMEEVCYVDEIALLAVDHPVGTQAYPDERLALDGDLPTERIYIHGEPIRPVAAVDHDGRDILADVTARDRRYPELRRDERYLGYLDREHAWTLDFGDRLDGMGDDTLVLYIHGWVEYPYSHVVYASGQSEVVGQSLSIDFRQPDGSWRVGKAEVGYPAGMPKMMTVTLPAEVHRGSSALRLRTNLEVYVDEVYIAAMGDEPALVTRVTASYADLHHGGYPREFSADGRLPRLYDYTSIDRSFVFRNMRGLYTRYGDVVDLLDGADDRYVVMGRGEELTVSFDASAFPPVPEGMTRSFILDTDGYCKDMDLYTAEPDTVEPLPFHAMSAYPPPRGERYPDTAEHRDYRQEYQTRRK
jgi:tetratricopeptide (TPR) repeat protein